MAPTSAEVTEERRRVEAEVHRVICAKVIDSRDDGSPLLCSLALYHPGRHMGVPRRMETPNPAYRPFRQARAPRPD
ncbi:MAG TPA: hypothetical protein VFH45_08090 [Acidimicrobiales bacterium]|nr:hypothetical protein [Acidimicrobiales bacterium]